MIERRRLVTAAAMAAIMPRAWGEAAVTVVATDIHGGKGVVPLRDGSFIAPEFVTGNVLRISAGGAKKIIATVGFGMAGAAPGPDGSVYIAKMGAASMGGGPPGKAGFAAGAIFRLDPATGAIKPLYLNDPAGKPLPGPNDLVFDGFGDFWFSDYAAGKVYCARADGSALALVVPDLPGAHGIALSPDRKTLYVIYTGANASRDNPPKQLAAYPITGRATLDLAARRRLGPFPVTGQFDGLKTEADGNLLAASWQGGIVTVGPEGHLLGSTPVLGKQVISATFCGPDLRQLVCMVNGASPASGSMVRLAWPRPGLRLIHG